MSAQVGFHVYGTPKPQGSKRHVGNGILVESAGEALKTWREDVKHAALRVRAEHGELTGPLMLFVHFYLARPKSHWRTGKNAHLLSDRAPDYPAGRPDLDKLLRSTCDAITSAGLYGDDAQVVAFHAWKSYAREGLPPGAHLVLQAPDHDERSLGCTCASHDRRADA